MIAACTTTEDPKLLGVENQTDRAIHVEMGDTDFGVVAAHTRTEYLEIDDGKLPIRFDGQIVGSQQLASDNLGGEWSLLIQQLAPNQVIFGFELDQ